MSVGRNRAARDETQTRRRAQRENLDRRSGYQRRNVGGERLFASFVKERRQAGMGTKPQGCRSRAVRNHAVPERQAIDE
jgi:hypothetical protein